MLGDWSGIRHLSTIEITLEQQLKLVHSCLGLSVRPSLGKAFLDGSRNVHPRQFLGVILHEESGSLNEAAGPVQYCPGVGIVPACSFNVHIEGSEQFMVLILHETLRKVNHLTIS